MIETGPKQERALAISATRKGGDREVTIQHLEELAFLAKTAGADVVELIYQELATYNKATLIGSGKVEEISQIIEIENIDLVIFDNDLSSVQARNLENKLNIKVLDRSGIILDIFAERAKTLEAKTQVELAQLQYILPRLTRMWTHLSKQFGGIGTKGPGETQIETDRRIIRDKIGRLKEKLADIDVQKSEQRKNRERLPRYALVGYTNAGKSTLMKLLTNTDVYIEDKLFATLDTTVRSFELPSGTKALISDTVGFIRKLPAHLVASFRSTLAEAREAEFLLHVVDISQKQFREHIEVVNSTLKSLNIDIKDSLIIFNKIDNLEELEGIQKIREEYPGSIFISAKRGINIRQLLDEMQRQYEINSNEMKIMLPWAKSSLVNILYSTVDIINKEDKDQGTIYNVRVLPEKQQLFDHYFREFRIN